MIHRMTEQLSRLYRNLASLPFAFALISLMAAPGKSQEPIEDSLRPIVVQAIQGDGVWKVATDVPAEFRTQLPIGVFDSGIGGLTVLEAILGLDAFDNKTLKPGADGHLDFEGERFIYLGDQANMPYGNYASVGKQDYLRELIIKDAIFLLGRRYWRSMQTEMPSYNKMPVKAIAIGCNTATAYGLNDIRQAISYWNLPVPVVGVVEAGARGLLEQDVNPSKTVAVLATVGTCNTGAYPKTIASTLGIAGKQVPQVIQQGFVELAAAIEGDSKSLEKGSVRDYVRRDVRKLVESYKQSGRTEPIGYVVLGCTHFPLVHDEFVAAFSELKREMTNGKEPYNDLISESIQIVNPAELTAKELFRTIAREKIRAKTKGIEQKQDEHQLFLSVADPTCNGVAVGSDGGFTAAYKYDRECGNLDREDYRIVPLTKDLLPESSKNLLETRLPKVWSTLQEDTSLSQTVVKPK